jgi:hypothetical protein
MVIISIYVRIIVTQGYLVYICYRFSHAVKAVCRAIVLQENEICVRHCENGQHEHEYKVSDILYHID